jgi:CelD/BcsL family acetyltransferase involved in cellulose biosynthesis
MTIATTTGLPVTAQDEEAAPALSATVASGIAGIEAHTAQWRRLAQAARGFTVFQTVDFVTGWSRAFLADDSQLKVVLVQKGSVPVALLAVVVHRRGLVTTARIAGAPVNQYDDVLIDPAADPVRVMNVAWQALRRSCGIDLMLLTRVRADSALAEAVRQWAKLGATDEAPFAALGDGGADGFMETVKKRLRWQLSKRRRQLGEIGACDFTHAQTPDEAATWMKEALEMKRDWLARTGRLSRAFVDPRTNEFLVDAARSVGAGGAELPPPAGGSRILMSRLTVGGKTAAIEAGFVGRASYHLFLGAFADEFSRFGPGNVLSEAVVRSCADNGIRHYDMLAPDSRSKRDWATGSVTVTDFALPLSALGWLSVFAVHRTLLPALRGLFYRLPLPLRSLIAGRALAS